MDFAKVLDELSRFLTQRRIRFAIAGAFALHAWGLTRATGDLDLAVEDHGRDELLRFLASLGYEQLHASEGYSNHVHPDAALGRLDFIYLDPHTADLIFSGARSMPLLPGIGAPVPRAEHLAAMKVLAMKNDPSRTFQDLADIQFLLGLPGVDKAEIRGYFDKQGLSWRFDEIAGD